MNYWRLGYAVLVFWLAAIAAADHTVGLKGLMARHHAGLLDPSIAVANAALAPLVAAALTVIWWLW